MPKKRNRKADTIKIEGLSRDTIRAFEPKDDSLKEDKLWEEYFRGSPNALGFPVREAAFIPVQGNQQAIGGDTAVTSPAAVTAVSTVLGSKGEKRRTVEQQLLILDTTHTKSEQIVYSIMYRETISKGKNEEYFSLRKLMRKTGIGSDKTVFNALKGLRSKQSIKMVEHSNNKPIGTLYKVFTPKEIFNLREKTRMIIDINTKRIINTTVAAATAPISVENDASVDDAEKRLEPSLRNRRLKDDDIVFDHKASTISLYRKYTKNPWKPGDDKFYEVVENILLEVIEAAIISSILRSQGGIGSFAYCEGVINEFKDNLAPGYLGYLRRKWKEVLG